MNLISNWVQRYFSDPQAIVLVILMTVVFGVVLFLGDMLAPVLASVVLAYLLEGVVRWIHARGVPRPRTVVLVFLVFMAFLFFIIFGLMPMVWTQTLELTRELPGYIASGQEKLMRIPEHYSFISQAQVNDIILTIRRELTNAAQQILSVSLASIVSIITVLVYLVLMPLLVFFFLKDRDLIIGWFKGFLPPQLGLAEQIWRDVDVQIGNYVRGKFWEILIVGAVTFMAFALMGIKYATLLSVIVGLSVLVPYIGATVVTVPVAVVAYFQWGWTAEFGYLMAAYAVIQALDGNVLVPLLFSEVVNLHPVAIIVAVLVFGGLWGFWGVFFAIPLATLVNAILNAWPRPTRSMFEEPDEVTA